MENNDYKNLSRKRRYELKKKKSKKNKFWKIFFTILTLMLISGGVYGAYTWNNIKNSANKGYKEVAGTSDTENTVSKFSMLVLGIDENDARASQGQTKESSRTDSMIYMAVNKDKNRMDMLSIPRDSISLMRNELYNKDPNAFFYDKITHAHVFDGVGGSITAVENLLNAPINFYVLVNFKAFEQTVDSLGGINLYVPFDMVENNDNDARGGSIRLKQGWQTLNGKQALSFCRSRKYDSDMARGQRQLQVIHAVIDKAKSLDALSKINEIITIGGDNVTHNLNTKQITSIISMFLKNDINVVTHQLEGYNIMYNGVYYFYPKPSHLLYASSVLRDTLDLPLPNANDILNIHYQGRISMLRAIYSNNPTTNAKNYQPARIVNLLPEDLITNLPDKLTKEDLKNDPTVSKNPTQNKQQN